MPKQPANAKPQTEWVLKSNRGLLRFVPTMCNNTQYYAIRTHKELFITTDYKAYAHKMTLLSGEDCVRLQPISMGRITPNNYPYFQFLLK